mmetsp:Transcript_43561/g.93287  ORF Transcript_43561/g.93287 Transcript_43561/m.93287 type:complete len:1108 (-) Transcript_43561:231-3554(-)
MSFSARREAAFAFLKALDNQLRTARGGESGLGLYERPEGVHVRPPSGAEVRVKHPRTGRYGLFNRETKDFVEELPGTPALLEKLRVLHIYADQCSIGWSAVFFALEKRALVCNLFNDPYHRDWNDIKAALSRSPHGLWKCVVFLSFAWNLNYSPWGEGDYYHLRKEALRHLLSQSNIQSDWFQTAMFDIAAEKGWPAPDTPERQQSLFNSLENAETFCKKGPAVKMMRWFSWFVAAEFWMSDWTLNRVVYSHYARRFLGKDDEEASSVLVPLDPAGASGGSGSVAARRQELWALRKTTGNPFQLCLRLTTETAKENAKVMAATIGPYWREHGQRAASKKTAADHLEYSQKMASGSWCDQVRSSLRCSLADVTKMPELGLATGALQQPAPKEELESQVALAGKICSAALLLATERVQSLSVFEVAPAIFAKATVSEEAVAAVAVEGLRDDWNRLTKLELLAISNKSVASLLDKVYWRSFKLVRITYGLWERGGWSHLDVDAKSFTEQQFLAPGDTKVIEDTHHCLRAMSLQQQSNAKSTRVRRQHTAIASNVLESRGLQTLGDVPLDTTKARQCEKAAELFHPGGGRLSAAWTAIMGKKTWNAPAPENSVRGHAAWQVLSQWDKGGRRASLDLAELAALFHEQSVCQEKASGRLVLCLGSQGVAALAWPMVRAQGNIPTNDAILSLDLGSTSGHVWIVTFDSDEWEGIPTKPHTARALRQMGLDFQGKEGIRWLQTGPAERFLRFGLRLGIDLLVPQIKMLLRLLEVDHRGLSKKQDLLEKLVTHVMADDAAEAMMALSGRRTKEEEEEALADEDLEEVMEAMPSMKEDFPNLSAALRRKRAKGEGKAKVREKETATTSGRKGTKRKRDDVGEADETLDDLFSEETGPAALPDLDIDRRMEEKLFVPDAEMTTDDAGRAVLPPDTIAAGETEAAGEPRVEGVALADEETGVASSTGDCDDVVVASSTATGSSEAAPVVGEGGVSAETKASSSGPRVPPGERALGSTPAELTLVQPPKGTIVLDIIRNKRVQGKFVLPPGAKGQSSWSRSYGNRPLLKCLEEIVDILWQQEQKHYGADRPERTLPGKLPPEVLQACRDSIKHHSGEEVA